MNEYLYKRKKCRCSECSLAGMRKVYGYSGTENPGIVIIGEAPGAKEDSQGYPFVGPAGNWLKRALDAANLLNHKVHKTNVILCKPPHNDLSSDEGEIAVEKCREGFIEEMRSLADNGAKVFIPVGNEAMAALGIDGKISKSRGSVYLIDEEVIPNGKERGIVALPTYHPSYIMRGQKKEEPIWIGDFAKAKKIYREGWTAPKEHFNIHPTVTDVWEFSREVIKNKTPLGVDIETTSLDSERGVIWCIALSTSGEDAIVIPFYKQGGGRYWDTKNELKVRSRLGSILKQCPTIYQNSLFDVAYLENKGYEVGHIQDDTMLLHHCLAEDTLIDTLDYGKIPIKDLKGKSNFYVVSYNGDELVPSRVSKVWKTAERRDDMVRVVFWSKNRSDKESMWIDCTSDHKIPTHNRGWIEAGDLKPGDRLIKGQSNREVAEKPGTEHSRVRRVFRNKGWKSRTRSEATVLRWQKDNNCRVISVVPLKREVPVYDMTVENTHNYSANGVIVSNSISPELPHDLGFLVSVYGRTPYWKDVVLNSEEKIKAQDDVEFRTYNARDAVVLHQILPELYDDLEKLGAHNIYEEISMPLVRPVMSMTKNGMYIKENERLKFRKELQEEMDEHIQEMYRIGELDENISISSPDDQRYIFFGRIPAKYERAKKALEKYEQNDKLKKNTKKYKNLIATVCAIENTKPLYKTKAKVKRTESGLPAADSEALLQIQVQANNRIDKINKFRRKKPEHEEEKKEIEKLLSFIDHFKKWKDAEKLFSTFTSYPVGKDGRVHFNYKIHGTASGRLSSGGKGTAGNAQNIPKEAKKIFYAEEGNVIIQADYSNLELRVLAYESGDDVLKETFARGENVHTNNCKLLFGIDEDHPMWKEARRASKVYIFGRNYGGTLRGVFEKVVKDVPELKLTFNRFQKIDETYRKHHPKYAEWYDKTVEQVKNKRELKNAFGRVRYFNGMDNEVVREGLNFPIQSLAADIMNIAMIDMYKKFQINSHLEAMLIGTVHDSVLIECPRKNAQKVMRIARESMERPYTIRGERTWFPVDFELGTCWGDLEEVEVE